MNHQVVYDLQPIRIAVWTEGRKRPAIFALEIPTIPIRQLADWAMENLNPGLKLTSVRIGPDKGGTWIIL